MIGIVIAVLVAILLLGVIFKLVKVAIIVALAFGVVMVLMNTFGNKRIK